MDPFTIILIVAAVVMIIIFIVFFVWLASSSRYGNSSYHSSRKRNTYGCPENGCPLVAHDHPAKCPKGGCPPTAHTHPLPCPRLPSPEWNCFYIDATTSQFSESCGKTVDGYWGMSWHPSEDVNHPTTAYKIYIKEGSFPNETIGPGNSNFVITRTAHDIGTSYVFYGPDVLDNPDQPHSFAIAAINSCGESKPSKTKVWPTM